MKRPTLYSGILWVLGPLALCGWLAGCNTGQQETAAYIRASMEDTSVQMKATRAELEAKVHDAPNPDATARALQELAAFDEAYKAFDKANTVVQQTLTPDGKVNPAGIAVAVAAAAPVPYGALAGIGAGLVYAIIERQRERARAKAAAPKAAEANAKAQEAIAQANGGA